MHDEVFVCILDRIAMVIDNPKNEPNRSDRSVVAFLGKAAAIVAAAGALVAAAVHFIDDFKPFCATIGICHEKPPNLDKYDPPPVGHGHTAETECEPMRAKYAAQYKEFDIKTVPLPADIHKSIFGRVTYSFHCEFVASHK